MRSDPAAPLTVAYIGVGSNLCDPLDQVRQPIGELACIADSRLLACSALYRTAPVGPQDQPDFINAAVALETRLSARILLDALQTIERSHGRLRDGTRWGPRTLDLDLLIYGDASIDLPGLRVPHPEVANRAFVLAPLGDVAPVDLDIPERGRLSDLLAQSELDCIIRLDTPEVVCCGVAEQLAESGEIQQE